MSSEIEIAIFGGSGYGAGELLRLAAVHPSLTVRSVISSSNSGEKIADVHPHLGGVYQDTFDSELDLNCFSSNANKKVVITALPHGISGNTIAGFFEEAQAANVKIVDLSGDLRLSDKAARAQFYPEAKVPENVASHFVYGAPEFNLANISKASFIANPGCLSFTSLLAIKPLADAGVEGSVAIDAKTGTSGAGRAPQQVFHHPQTNANAFAYKIFSHRHEPEISQFAGSDLELTFLPHVIPTSRGIYCSAHFFLKKELGEGELKKIYSEYYTDAPFVRIRENAPQLKDVVGSNFCDLAIFSREKSVLVLAATDNLVKGMAGTAIQNINIICGLEQTTGLFSPGMGPI